jgi:hypothetical protein
VSVHSAICLHHPELTQKLKYILSRLGNTAERKNRHIWCCNTAAGFTAVCNMLEHMLKLTVKTSSRFILGTVERTTSKT